MKLWFAGGGLARTVERALARWDRVDEDLRFRTERWTAGFALATTVLCGYMALSAYNVYRFDGLLQPTVSLWTAWDSHIPFIPQFYWPYLLYYFLVFAPVFLAQARQHLAEQMLAYAMVSTIGWACWLVFPVRMEFPPLACSGLSCDLVARLQRNDTGVNVMPSLHVAHSVLAASVFVTYRHRLAWLVGLAAFAVALSTVLLKQHYVVDVPVGAILGAAGWSLAHRITPAVERNFAAWRRAVQVASGFPQHVPEKRGVAD